MGQRHPDRRRAAELVFERLQHGRPDERQEHRRVDVVKRLDPVSLGPVLINADLAALVVVGQPRPGLLVSQVPSAPGC